MKEPWVKATAFLYLLIYRLVCRKYFVYTGLVVLTAMALQWSTTLCPLAIENTRRFYRPIKERIK